MISKYKAITISNRFLPHLNIMKLILIVITTITGVLGGKCPAKEIIAPCECTKVNRIKFYQNLINFF